MRSHVSLGMKCTYIYLPLQINRNAYAGGQEGQLPPLPASMGRQKGQELPVILNSFHLSYFVKWHFPALHMVWFKKIFLGASPQTPNYTRYNYETNILHTLLSEKSLKTNNYPCRGTYIYKDVPSEEALPLLPGVPAGVPAYKQYKEVTTTFAISTAAPYKTKAFNICCRF